MWLASTNMNTCRVKTGEICSGSMAAVLAVSVFSGEWAFCRAVHWEAWSFLICMAETGSLLFIFVISHLYMSQICQSLGGVKPKLVLLAVLPMFGEAVHSLHFPFSYQGNSF